MDCRKWLLCFSKAKRQMEEERFSWFSENGSKLLEGLVASSDGRYGIPYRSFSAKELIRATTNFKDRVMYDGSGEYFGGFFCKRSILVKRFPSPRGTKWNALSYAINDIVISLQMSYHKNVCKLLGCCLEFEDPVLVYEYESSNTRLLSDILIGSSDKSFSKGDDSSLSWRVRLKLAVGIANALVYLHSTFATPIIHRDLSAQNIVLCSNGVAKLLDFTLCIALPPGESQVEDIVLGVTGTVEPEYATSGIITEKTDVYMFGVLLLQLLTAEKPDDLDHKFLTNHVEDHFVNDKVDKILDPTLLAEKVGNEQAYELQMQAFAELALRCTRHEGKDRPDMLTVAKELVQIKKSVCFSLA